MGPKATLGDEGEGRVEGIVCLFMRVCTLCYTYVMYIVLRDNCYPCYTYVYCYALIPIHKIVWKILPQMEHKNTSFPYEHNLNKFCIVPLL